MSLEHTRHRLLQNGQFQLYKFPSLRPVPALNINHPAGHLLPRPLIHAHYHVHARNCAVVRPPSHPLSW